MSAYSRPSCGVAAEGTTEVFRASVVGISTHSTSSYCIVAEGTTERWRASVVGIGTRSISSYCLIAEGASGLAHANIVAVTSLETTIARGCEPCVVRRRWKSVSWNTSLGS
jgi:hypothetical protein